MNIENLNEKSLEMMKAFVEKVQVQHPEVTSKIYPMTDEPSHLIETNRKLTVENSILSEANDELNKLVQHLKDDYTRLAKQANKLERMIGQISLILRNDILE